MIIKNADNIKLYFNGDSQVFFPKERFLKGRVCDYLIPYMVPTSEYRKSTYMTIYDTKQNCVVNNENMGRFNLYSNYFYRKLKRDIDPTLSKISSPHSMVGDCELVAIYCSEEAWQDVNIYNCVTLTIKTKANKKTYLKDFGGDVLKGKFVKKITTQYGGAIASITIRTKGEQNNINEFPLALLETSKQFGDGEIFFDNLQIDPEVSFIMSDFTQELQLNFYY